MEIPVPRNPRVAHYLIFAGAFIYLVLPCPLCYIGALLVVYGFYAFYQILRS